MTLSVPQAAARMEGVLAELRRVVVGQQRVLERVLVALLADGHCLLEGVPGIGKTLTVSTLARTLGGTFARIQFTPDLVPSDLVGTRVYRPSSERFDVELGPVFANFVLADEINRAPAKVQSALLEVMGERQVSIGGVTHRVPEPFLVLATQNPIESEGVYPLPEAQRDRFLMRIPVDYPTDDEEHEIVRRAALPTAPPAELLGPDDVADLQRVARSIYVDPVVADYAVRLVIATRRPGDAGLGQLAGLLAYGASPRASLGLVAAARAIALLRGRAYALPQDVYDVAYDVLNHRLVLSFDALADGVGVDDVLVEVLSEIEAPSVVPSELETRAGSAA
ncbi:MAG: MoxR-like ATPase [Acidimicrobiia bacterium]|nr:MAG: MoxR-like ATPase [Acidimicrobiia bacterium]